MYYEFKAGDRVSVVYSATDYLPVGATGVVISRYKNFGLNEYLVEIDDNPYSNIAGWSLLEEDLEAEDA
jgi:hypothetical protein